VGFVKGETKKVLKAERRGRKIGICGNWVVDAKKLAVRDRKQNCSGSTPAWVQRLRVGEVCRAPRACRRAVD